jgi:uncharacterized protein YndB with AHSA1/START domain
MTTMTAVHLQRTFPASPQRLYRAWLDPEVLSRWLAVGGRRVTRAEVDERVGGVLRIWQSGPDGEADGGGFEAELLELVPDERLVFLWRFVGPDRAFDPSHDSRLTISLRPVGDGATELTLTHERLENFAAAMPEVAVHIETGWQLALDELAGAA